MSINKLNEQSKTGILNQLQQQAKIDHQARESLADIPPEKLLEVLEREHQVATSEIEDTFFSNFRQTNLLDAIDKLGFLTPLTLTRVKEESQGQALIPYLLSQGHLNEEQAARSLALSLNLDFMNLESIKLDDELFNTIDIKLMKEKFFIPLKREKNYLKVVMADPGQVDDIEYIEYQIGTSIFPSVAPRPTILKLINLMVETSLDSKVLFSDMEETQMTLIPDEDVPDDEKTYPGKEDETTIPVVQLVNSIILKAVRKGASDIHFETYENIIKVKYRIDGILHEILSNLDTPFRDAIIARIKIMSNLDIAEKRVPQDGRFKLSIDQRNVDFRVSILPAIHGEVAVLRILDKSFLGLDLQNVGLEGRDLTTFKRNVSKPYGLALVAGPTGSGKTTTLYSALQFIYSPESKVITIEDPVEFQMPDITQIQVNEKKGLTFAAGLRSIVRQDPDKIMVGEIRDPETAQIAINAALTGHLVLSTIHANNVIDTISRLIRMDLDVYEFTSSLNLILSQRLVRKICPSCKIPDETISEDEKIIIGDYESHKHLGFFQGEGCRYCHQTGFKGRNGIFETMGLTRELRQLILDRAPPVDIQQLAIEQGMKTLREVAWMKLAQGETSFREINRVTFEEN